MRTNPANRAPPSPDEAPASPDPGSPEAIFLAWLLWLPSGREPAKAARDELARIDRHPRPLPPAARRLRAMFVAVLATGTAPDPVTLVERSTPS